jgi:predicted  nucleic acid-binding Zn-ribbon protein
MQDSLSDLSPELVSIHQRLVTIRRQLVALTAKEGTQKAELKPLQEELRKIDSLSAFIIIRQDCLF